LAIGLGAELRTKPWVERAREVVGAAGRLPAVLAIADAPVIGVDDSRPQSGSSGSATSTIFGSTLDTLSTATDGLLDIANLHLPAGLGIACLAPLAGPAASEALAAAFVASGAASDPALCHAFAETMREDGIDGVYAVAGVSSFLAGAICSSGLGVYRTPNAYFVDPEAALGLSPAALTDAVAGVFAEAGRRLAAASRKRPSPASASITYDNAAYALALADPAEAVPSLAARVLRLATAVSKSRGGTTSPAEVVPLILASAVVTDVLYFAPPSLASAPAGYPAVVAAFAAAAQPGLRPLRGLPAHVDTAAVRAMVRSALIAPARLPLPPAPPAAGVLLAALLSPGAGAGAPMPAPAPAPSLAASLAPAPAPPPTPAPKREVCGLWKRGACRFGDECKYLHEPRAIMDKQ
jgi:hypothetical protein